MQSMRRKSDTQDAEFDSLEAEARRAERYLERFGRTFAHNHSSEALTMTQLTQHFALEELTFSSTAQRLGIDNTPDLGTVAHLTRLAMGLEQIRALLGVPMHIDSGYRCPALNKAVGGVPNSAHVDGYAADFIAPDYGSPTAIARAIAGSGIRFDQCIVEANAWVHVSFDPRMRHQALTATFGPNGATYSGGV